MNNLYYITRTWTEKDKGNNCALLRVAYAEILAELFNVIIVTPNYESKEVIIRDNIIKIPYLKKYMGINHCMEQVGLIEDYLDSWVTKVINYLSKILKKNDVVYATVGGELASIKIASRLKRKINCKMVINFRDPVDRTLVRGEMTADCKGVCREKRANKYIMDADIIITSAEQYSDVLKEKFPYMADKIFCHYLGFQDLMNDKVKERLDKEQINIVFAGNMNFVHNIELLYNAFKRDTRFKITFITKDNDELKAKMPEKNIVCLPLMKRNEYINYMKFEADIAYVSLRGVFSEICVPSRIYDYISLNIPILGAFRRGSARSIIEENGFGLVCDEDDQDSLRKLGYDYLNENIYRRISKNIVEKKMDWYMLNRKKEFLEIIRNIIEE